MAVVQRSRLWARVAASSRRRWRRGDRPGTPAGMAVSLHHVVIDAHDLPAMARFWAQVLGWRILSEREREVVIGADATASSPSAGWSWMAVCGLLPEPSADLVERRQPR
jgi:Glyoxalase-like domain